MASGQVRAPPPPPMAGYTNFAPCGRSLPWDMMPWEGRFATGEPALGETPVGSAGYTHVAPSAVSTQANASVGCVYQGGP